MERSSTDGTKAAGADTADGIYTIQGKLWKADEDRASMGNASLTGDSTSQIALFRIRKSGDSTLLQLEFHPLTAIGFTRYLYGFSYFPQATDIEQIPKNMTGQGTQYAKLLLDWSTLQKTEQDITTVATDAASDTGPGPLTDLSGTAGTGQTDNGTDSSTNSKTDTSTSDASKDTSTFGSSGS